MFTEHGLIINRITQSFDLVSDICFSFIQFLERVIGIVLSLVSVLNWARIAVVVNESPVSLVCLQNLVWKIRQLDLLRGDDELVSLVA